MKKITSKLVAVLMIVVMAFGISGTATVKTEAKESKGYVIKVNLGTNCTTVYKNGKVWYTDNALILPVARACGNSVAALCPGRIIP